MSRFVDNTLLKGGWVNGNNLQKGEKKEKISSAKGRQLSFHNAKIGIYVGVARLSQGFFIISRGKKPILLTQLMVCGPPFFLQILF